MQKSVAFALAGLILLSSIVPTLAATSNFEVVSGSEMVTPDGKLAAGRTVFSELTLAEVSRSLTGKTRLKLTTELDNPVWTILVDEEDPETYTAKSFSDFVFDHESYDEVTIQIRGTTPLVGVETSVVIMDVKQVIAPEISDVYTIKRDVTSEKISDALDAIYRAQDKITEAEGIVADAKDAGADVTEAEADLQTARNFYNTSDALYRSGQMNESIAAANNAYDNAVKACNSATGASGHKVLTSRLIYAAAIIAILVIAVVVYQKRRWERL